jgi:hypothetical protein
MPRLNRKKVGLASTSSYDKKCAYGGGNPIVSGGLISPTDTASLSEFEFEFDDRDGKEQSYFSRDESSRNRFSFRGQRRRKATSHEAADDGSVSASVYSVSSFIKRTASKKNARLRRRKGKHGDWDDDGSVLSQARVDTRPSNFLDRDCDNYSVEISLGGCDNSTMGSRSTTRPQLFRRPSLLRESSAQPQPPILNGKKTATRQNKKTVETSKRKKLVEAAANETMIPTTKHRPPQVVARKSRVDRNHDEDQSYNSEASGGLSFISIGTGDVDDDDDDDCSVSFLGSSYYESGAEEEASAYTREDDDDDDEEEEDDDETVTLDETATYLDESKNTPSAAPAMQNNKHKDNKMTQKRTSYRRKGKVDNNNRDHHDDETATLATRDESIISMPLMPKKYNTSAKAMKAREEHVDESDDEDYHDDDDDDETATLEGRIIKPELSTKHQKRRGKNKTGAAGALAPTHKRRGQTKQHTKHQPYEVDSWYSVAMDLLLLR